MYMDAGIPTDSEIDPAIYSAKETDAPNNKRGGSSETESSLYLLGAGKEYGK